MPMDFPLTGPQGWRKMTPTQSARDFYRRWLMARKFDPADFGIDMEREFFIDALADDFNDYIKGMMTVDEMLLRPRTALHFCDYVRAKRHWFDLPDDIILRTILNRRKSPAG